MKQLTELVTLALEIGRFLFVLLHLTECKTRSVTTVVKAV